MPVLKPALLLIAFCCDSLWCHSTNPLTQTYTAVQERVRHRRQFTERGPQIDLNVTVPYIFSARLYPYGPDKSDQLAQIDPQPLDLHSPLKLLGRQYQTLLIHRDGYVSLSPSNNFFPTETERPVIALFWMASKGGKVFYRETTDPAILSLAKSEVNIQYRYGNGFKPTSVLIITWEGSSSAANLAGFSGSPFSDSHFYLPGSGTPAAANLVQKSNVGIPGEWLFRIDEEQIFLCGAGFKGLECVDSCGPNEWYLDCSKECHCLGGTACNTETGACPQGQCSPGWTNGPTCDEDVDECQDTTRLCPPEQPDCVNTAGSYLCLCFEYDNRTNSCKSSTGLQEPAERIPVAVMPLIPQISQKSTQRPVRLREQTTFKVDPEQESDLVVNTPKPLIILPSLGTKPHLTPVAATLAPACSQCDPNGHCEQEKCVCNVGWQGDGIDCIDIDECQQPNICGPNAVCQNTLGAYQCVCDVGFVATNRGCEDLDECAEGIVTCRGGISAKCVNKPGSFECQCASGYSGSPDSPQGCQDINECDTPELYCGNKAQCKNTVGSYACECFEGYEKAHNSTTCVDVNECLLSPCDPAAVCTNLDGSFQCKCIEGFVGDGVHCRETILFPTSPRDQTLPHLTNAVLPFRLNQPIKVFGKDYDTAYISANGVVSFDRAFTELVPDPRIVRSVAFFPWHRAFTAGSVVSFKEVTEYDAANYGLLSRASLFVQNRFNLHRFQASRLFVVTYENMLAPGSSQLYSFQMVLAQSADATFLFYLYEAVELGNEQVFVGVTHSDGFFEFPSKAMAAASNVGQRGKWMARVDLAGKAELCPAGKRTPPFCDDDCSPGTWGFSCRNNCKCADKIPCDLGTGICANGKCELGYQGPTCADDVDECHARSHNCHSNAVCSNTIGSFTCKCRPMFVGDGVQSCEEMNECFKRFNKNCAANARCDVTNPDYPECVCMEGFHGDGRRSCQPDSTATTTTSTTSTTTTSTRPRVVVGPKESSEESHVFSTKSWNSIEADPHLKNASATVTTAQTTQTTPRRTHKGNEVSVAKDYDDTSSDITVGAKLDDNVDTSGMLFLIVPGIVVGVWLVLVVVVLIQCCRRRRNVRFNKYTPQMMGYGQRNDFFAQSVSN